jgi:hypothetical protein
MNNAESNAGELRISLELNATVVIFAMLTHKVVRVWRGNLARKLALPVPVKALNVDCSA